MNVDWTNIVTRIENREGADWTKPPESYEAFVADAVKINERKDSDYDSRFMRGLNELDAFAIWAWEVDKKLDRIRTWIKRGELQVKGEGIRNSVEDLYVYTVQYELFNSGVSLESWKQNRERLFKVRAEKNPISAWISLLIYDGRIEEDELLLQLIIRKYMGDTIQQQDWKAAIRLLLQ